MMNELSTLDILILLMSDNEIIHKEDIDSKQIKNRYAPLDTTHIAILVPQFYIFNKIHFGEEINQTIEENIEFR